MSRIFISHSSRDNAAAVALNGWLRENGWDDVFLDLDPERGIKAGERWERSLHEAADRCQAVIFLVSRNWLASQWCGKEFDLAAKLNKRMFGVLIDDFAIRDIPPRFTDTWQFTNLATGQDHRILRAVVPPDDREEHVTFSQKGLRRLKVGLSAAGLDPTFFEWPPSNDPDRAPYTGLPPMEEVDAGIFFGREADIVRALDELRGLARKAPPRLFVIEGASGCGKSSFLRAGLIPRLKRDDRNYLVLPPIRPEQAAIEGARGFVSALTTGFAEAGVPRDRADLRALMTAPDDLEAALADLAARKSVPAMPGEAEPAPPAIVIPVDQAEELFQSAGRDRGRRLLELLASLARSKAVRVVIVFTIRTDDYEPLQTASAFEAMPQHIFGLAPIPIGRLGAIIEGPARRLTESEHTERTLTIEPALVVHLLKDLQEGAAADVMPLCAFILERLWREYGSDGKLKLHEYENTERGLGGIRGAIEGAVAAAFAEPHREPAIPADSIRREALLRLAMIPALAAIDPETRTPRRRVAQLSEISEEARALIERLVTARLISTDRDPKTKERTVEPAHEALLRQWSLMQTWLDEDARELLVLEGVERAATDWEENGRGENWLAHAGGRLEDAERLRGRPDFAPRLADVSGDYLDACRAADSARRDKELADARRIAAEQEARATAESARAEEEKARAAADRRARDRTRIGLVAAVVLLVGAVWFYLESEKQTQIAEQQTRAALSRQLAAQAQAALDDKPQLSLLLAIEALGVAEGGRKRAVPEAENALWQALENAGGWGLSGHERPVMDFAYDPEGRFVASAGADGAVQLWSVDGERPAKYIARLCCTDGPIHAAVVTPDGRRLVAAGFGVRVWDISDLQSIDPPLALTGNNDVIHAAALSTDGRWLATGDSLGQVSLWDLAVPDPNATPVIFHDHNRPITAVVFHPDGGQLVTADGSGTLRFWDLTADDPAASPPTVLPGHNGPVTSALFGSDGDLLITGGGGIESGGDGFILLWDLTSADPASAPVRLTGHVDGISALALSESGRWLASGGHDGTLDLWDLTDADPSAAATSLTAHDDLITELAFTAGDHPRLVSGSQDATIRIWEVPTDVFRVLHGHDGGVNTVDLSPDGRWLASGGRDSTGRLWDLTRQAPFAAPAILSLEGSWVYRLALSPDARWLFSQGSSAAVAMWDLRNDPPTRPTHALLAAGTALLVVGPTGRWVLTGGDSDPAQLWDVQAPEPANAMPFTLHDERSEDNDVGVSPDGRWVVTADGAIMRLWDLASDNPKMGRKVLRDRAWTDPIVAVSPNAEWLVAGGHGMAGNLPAPIRLWRTVADPAKSNEFLLSGHNGRLRASAISPDSRWLVTGADDDRYVRVWDLTADDPGRVPILLGGHQFGASGVAISPDGSWLATIDHQRVLLWDLTKINVVSKPIALRGHDGGVRALAFSGNGHRLASASDGPKRGEAGTVRLWDLTAPDPARSAVVLDHDSAVISLAFGADGNVLAAGGNGSVRIWDLRLEEMTELACRTSGRNFSSGEWEQYFGSAAYRKTCPEAPTGQSVLGGMIERLSPAPDGTPPPRSEVRVITETALAARDPELANAVCWIGATSGLAEVVLPACNHAVQLDPHSGDVRDSRGVARALTGDFQGAAKDFAIYVSWAEGRRPTELIEMRHAWIEQLRRGEDPFDETTLRALRE